MKRQKSYCQLKEQVKSLERTNNETDLTSLLHSKYKNEVIKMVKKLRKITERSVDHCDKEI